MKDGHLINPTVIEVDTGITAEMMSRDGIVFKGVDEEGKDVEDHLFKKTLKRNLSQKKQINHSVVHLWKMHKIRTLMKLARL